MKVGLYHILKFNLLNWNYILFYHLFELKLSYWGKPLEQNAYLWSELSISFHTESIFTKQELIRFNKSKQGEERWMVAYTLKKLINCHSSML